MSEPAPTDKGEMQLAPDEAIQRTKDLPVEKDQDDGPTLGDSDRKLQSLIDTGGETDYARIYLAFVTGEYNGNEMLWQRYVWLSKPGAYESDMWGSNGMSMRLVPGMEDAMPQAALSVKSGVQNGAEVQRFISIEGSN